MISYIVEIYRSNLLNSMQIFRIKETVALKIIEFFHKIRYSLIVKVFVKDHCTFVANNFFLKY